MQLSKHIGKAAWSTADKMLYLLMGLAFIIPQKVIGETNFGLYMIAQAFLTSIFMLSDGLALQAMVTFGMVPERRLEAITFSALVHALFIIACTLLIYFGRFAIADLFQKPNLVEVLSLFPLVSLGFLLRNFYLKVSQLHIDTRAAFMIDLAWIGSSIVLLLAAWRSEMLATANDMMLISAISSTISSLTGILIYGRSTRFITSIDRVRRQEMLRFGLTQLGSAATLVTQTTGDTLLMGRFVSAATIGNYNAAKMLFRGFEAIREAGSLFVYPAVARLHSQRRDKEMVLLVEKMIGFTLIVIIPMVLLVWIGPIEELFALIYKDKYREAPFIFQILSLAALAIPFSMNMNVLTGLGEARQSFRVTITAAILFFAFSLLLVPRFGGIGSAITLVLSYATVGVLSTLAVKRLVPFSVTGALGRWRDALEFGVRAWKRGRQRPIVRRVLRRPRGNAGEPKDEHH